MNPDPKYLIGDTVLAKFINSHDFVKGKKKYVVMAKITNAIFSSHGEWYYTLSFFSNGSIKAYEKDIIKKLNK